MSNSVVFLLIAVGLSMFGTLVVWLHGRPRRSRSSVDVFHQSLQALATTESHREPLSGVTVRPLGEADIEVLDDHEAEPADEPDPRARSPRPSPRPQPRSAASRRPRTSRQGADPGA